MAAGGDLGASIGPQLVGVVTDAAIKSPSLTNLAENFNLSAEQIGMKIGLLSGMLFPLIAALVFGYIKFKPFKKRSG